MLTRYLATWVSHDDWSGQREWSPDSFKYGSKAFSSLRAAKSYAASEASTGPAPDWWTVQEQTSSKASGINDSPWTWDAVETCTSGGEVIPA